MSISRFYLCAIPSALWQSSPDSFHLNLAQLSADALSCERRIAKEVNLQDEYTRYSLICQQLEQEVIQCGRIQGIKEWKDFHEFLGAERFPVMLCPDGYLSILSRIHDHPLPDARLGSSFYPPDQIENHQQKFSAWAQQQGLDETLVVKQRLEFLELAQRTNCGVVELQTSFLPSSADMITLTQYRGQTEKDETQKFVDIPKFEVSDLDRELFGEKGKKQHLLRILIRQIEEALKNNEPVSFGNQAPHDVITEALNHFVFIDDNRPLTPAKLRVAYSDGSEAEPFPILCLHQPAQANPKSGTRPLKFSLMSMRHFELDPEIDLCWFRNREVSRTRTLAETDEFCFKTTLEQLNDSLKRGDLYMHMYHTGFEPAVFGFYRGIVHKLLQLREKKTPSLSVLPLYFRGGNNYQKGQAWE